MTKLMDSAQQEKDLSGEHMTQTENNKQCCSACKTTKTPMWRAGPDGPKSLCNACGIRYKKRPTSPKNTVKKGRKGKAEGKKLMNSFKMKNLMIAVEEEVPILSPVTKRPRSPRTWGKAQRAAMLLMGLSRGAFRTRFSGY